MLSNKPAAGHHARLWQFIVALAEALQANREADAFFGRLEDDEGRGLAGAQLLEQIVIHEVSMTNLACARKVARGPASRNALPLALNGEPWAISQVADRIDGKATAEIQTQQMHRYVIEAPARRGMGEGIFTAGADREDEKLVECAMNGDHQSDVWGPLARKRFTGRAAPIAAALVKPTLGGP